MDFFENLFGRPKEIAIFASVQARRGCVGLVLFFEAFLSDLVLLSRSAG